MKIVFCFSVLLSVSLSSFKSFLNKCKSVVFVKRVLGVKIEGAGDKKRCVSSRSIWSRENSKYIPELSFI